VLLDCCAGTGQEYKIHALIYFNFRYFIIINNDDYNKTTPSTVDRRPRFHVVLFRKCRNIRKLSGFNVTYCPHLTATASQTHSHCGRDSSLL